VVLSQLRSRCHVRGDLNVDSSFLLPDVLVEQVLLFVVAEDTRRPALHAFAVEREFDAACAIRSTIDEVAEEDDVIFSSGGALFQQFVGFVATTVKVSYDDCSVCHLTFIRTIEKMRINHHPTT
jgi:hypothetical protein